MRLFFIIVFAIISFVLIGLGFMALNFVGFKGSAGGHGDVNITGMVFSFGLLCIIVGVTTSIITLCIIPWKGASNISRENNISHDSDISTK